MNELVTIVKDSGLDQTKSDYILKNFQGYFEMAAEWEKKSKAIVVTDASQIAEMKMARTGRLFLSKERIDVENARKKLKAEALREGKAIDGIANVLKALIIPIEEHLRKQEDFVKIQAEKKAEELRIEAEKKAEEEAAENLRLDLLGEERFKKAFYYRQYWKKDKVDFRNMTEEVFQKCMVALIKRKKEFDAEQEAIRAENEALRKENAEKDRKSKAEQKKADDARKAAEEKTRKDREAALQKSIDAQEKADAKQKAIEDKAEAEKKVAADKARKEKEELEEKLRNQIECPKCHHKFSMRTGFPKAGWRPLNQGFPLQNDGSDAI